MIAQIEAARAQQAAEAACIGLTLDEEKITSLSASTRRHLQGLALVIQVKLPPPPPPPPPPGPPPGGGGRLGDAGGRPPRLV